MTGRPLLANERQQLRSSRAAFGSICVGQYAALRVSDIAADVGPGSRLGNLVGEQVHNPVRPLRYALAAKLAQENNFMGNLDESIVFVVAYRGL